MNLKNHVLEKMESENKFSEKKESKRQFWGAWPWKCISFPRVYPICKANKQKNSGKGRKKEGKCSSSKKRVIPNSHHENLSLRATYGCECIFNQKEFLCGRKYLMQHARWLIATASSWNPIWIGWGSIELHEQQLRSTSNCDNKNLWCASCPRCHFSPLKFLVTLKHNLWKSSQ